MRLRSALAGLTVIAALFVAGCNGSNTTPPPVVGAAPTPTPTPVGTATPTPTPTPAPTPLPANVSSLAFTSSGSLQSFTVSEPGYSGAFTATSAAPNSCTGIATFTASATGPSGTFNVTALAGGTCQITVSDNHSGSVTITVYVTTTSGTVN